MKAEKVKRLNRRSVMTRWRQLSPRVKGLSVVLLFVVLIIGTVFLERAVAEYYRLLQYPSEDPYGTYAAFGLRIRNETVYADEKIRFTVFCNVETYGGFPIPEGDIYQITPVFLCLEKWIIDFNDSLGEIKASDEITILTGELPLGASEETRLEFQTSFPLHPDLQLYVGVFADFLRTDELRLYRWDCYTTVLPTMITIY